VGRKHEWKDGFRLGLDPSRVGKELEALRDKEGNIDVDDVWQKAKSKRSAMHEGFTWDKDAAALKCWRTEARYILRHLIVLHDRGPLKDTAPRAYVSVNNEGYRAIEPVLKAEDARAALVETVLNRYLSIQKEYQHVVELAKAHEGIKAAKADWEKKKAPKKGRKTARPSAQV
jgi:hypothetical protein